jgi:hypothetical protein
LIAGAALLQTFAAQNLDWVAAQTVAAPPEEQIAAPFSPALAELTRLAQSGVNDEVLVAFVKNSTSRFALSDESIIYLKDIGLSDALIAAMIDRDSELPVDLASTPAEPRPTVASSSGIGSEMGEAPYETNAPPDVDYFYNQLSPYGTWASVEGVGWCWQPHCCVLSHGWRPFCHGGHWVYTDCGWYWQSNYSWGWAPFHYGRWHHHERCGWVWCPGHEWAPAWVTWRVAGDHCGWAPLPLNSVYVEGRGWRVMGVYYKEDCDFGLKPEHFTFVAMNHFSSREIARHQLPVTEVRNIFESTSIINSSIADRNHIIMNKGVPVEQIAAATQSNIRALTIRGARPGSNKGDSMQSSEHAQLSVVRHELHTPPQPAHTIAQIVDTQHPTIIPHGIQYKGDPAKDVPAANSASHRTQPGDPRAPKPAPAGRPVSNR